MKPAVALTHAVVGAGALVMLAPFWFMFVFATHTNTEILSVPPPLWFGDALWDNLKLLLERLPSFWQNMGWSLYVAVCSTALTLLFCSMGGYAFAMFEFRFKQTLFALVARDLLRVTETPQRAGVLLAGLAGSCAQPHRCR